MYMGTFFLLEFQVVFCNSIILTVRAVIVIVLCYKIPIMVMVFILKCVKSKHIIYNYLQIKIVFITFDRVP